ncbi:hypothetical protein MC885_014420 [Smutsia gigantea]|nr:hypothetical protein MC885_014420 [Smutsia gigantea]
MHMKHRSVYQQTQALLCKNFLKKWRMKRESSLEWGFPILLGLYIALFAYFQENVHFPEMPPQDLGRVDKFNTSSIAVVYTPISNITQQIMNKTAFAPFLQGRRVIAAPNQKYMDKILLDNFLQVVGVIFNDTFSYKLKFFQGYEIPYLNEDLFTAHCWGTHDHFSCSLAKYWNRGFVTLQTAIDAAIIQIALTFLMSVLMKKTVLTNLVVFLLTLFWGCVGFTVYYRQLPSALEWILSICSPFAFTAGMTRIIHLDYNMNGVNFPDPSRNTYAMIATFSILAFDALFYLVLTLYFDKILPYGNERHYPPLFFLNASSCFQCRRIDNKVFEKETDPEHAPDDHFEPVPPEFQGREAIRIRNVRKEYKGISGKVEALKGLLFDVYEGEITAIMGQSGAGKSLLLNILNGLCVPTEGSVTIYNKNLSDMQDLEEIRKVTGVCPQSNVQFDILTVKENLRLFAKIKGIQPQAVEQEVQRILLELDIESIQDNLAEHLSEGQKRMLTFGIAILGDPQVLLLDEPTAGLDPFARHRVWSFLKERKADHVILLSTSFMDEADILADRKVIVSNGRLKCAGSSAFLKRKWGLGYHLSLYRNEVCDPEKVTSFINHHIPDAKLKIENKEKLVYILPVERTNKFPDLFSDLDKGTGQGVVSYDISTSTLNEVFMKLEGKPTTEHDFKQAEMIRDPEGLQEPEPAHSSLPEMQPSVSDMSLWRMQVCSIARLRFLKLKRGKKALFTLLLVFGIAIFPLMVEKILSAVLIQKSDWEFKPNLYFLSPGQLSQDPRTSLLIINNTVWSFYAIWFLFSENMLDYRFSVVCNTKRVHCFPILMNIISNALLRMFNCTQHIRIERGIFPFNYLFFSVGLQEGSIFLFLVVCSMPPYIAMGSISDHKRRAKSQLWISGLYPSAYWFGQALVDINLFAFIIFSMFLIFYIANIAHTHVTSLIVFALVVTTFGYAASLIFLTYVISFIFRKKRKCSSLWSFCFYITATIMFEITIHEHDLQTTFSGMIFIPSSTLAGFLVFLSQRVHSYSKYEDPNHDLREADLLVCLIPYFQALLFLFVLRCMETKCGKNIMQKDPIFRIYPHSRDAPANPEEPVDEDEDVQAERIRAVTALATASLEEVELKGCGSVWDQQGDGAIRFLGYCPQENALWPRLTVREHLEVFATVKGMRKADTTIAISRLVDTFKLSEQLNVPVQKLTAGARRKLCFMLSILGNSPVLLLDEPSSGMDPTGQQQMWQMIQAAIKNTEKGAILITHYLAEAEAICDRVAIMVSGRLRCIGSIQHLKSKLGEDYILELKIKDPSQVPSVHAEILKLFPQAAQQERYSSFLAYKLPVVDVHPLSLAFHKLEAVKQNFNLEEYSLSQCTLEKVFLELSKEQELGNLDEEVDTSMRWKLLPHSDDP